MCRGRINAQYDGDNVSRHYVVPLFRCHEDLYTFQHKNAQVHPALSPDLSPIDHLWDNIRCHHSQGSQQQNLCQLEASLLQAWRSIHVTQAVIQRLFSPMWQHCRACLSARGQHTLPTFHVYSLCLYFTVK